MEGRGKGDLLLLALPDEDFAPAVGHDEPDAKEVVGGFEAAGRDVALGERDQFGARYEGLGFGERLPYTGRPRSRLGAVGLVASCRNARVCHDWW